MSGSQSDVDAPIAPPPQPPPQQEQKTGLSFDQVRQRYPQYNDMSDDQLATGLHKKFYSDMPFDQFSAKIGYAPVKSTAAEGRNLPLAKQDEGDYVSSWGNKATAAAPTGEIPKTDADIPDSGLKRVGEATIGGFKQGMQDSALVSPKAQEYLDSIQREGGLKGRLAQLGSTAAEDVGMALTAPGAAYQGAMAGLTQTGKEIGVPQLGPAVGAFSEAFPQESMGMRGVLERPTGVSLPPEVERAAQAKPSPSQVTQGVPESVPSPMPTLERMAAEAKQQAAQPQPAAAEPAGGSPAPVVAEAHAELEQIAKGAAPNLPEPTSPVSEPPPPQHPTVPEPIRDIDAQVRAMTDPKSTKDAVFIAPGSPMPEVPDGVITAPRPDGTLLTTNPQKAQAFNHAQAVDEPLMASLLGFPETKTEAAASGSPRMVQAIDDKGNVQAEAVTSPQSEAETKQAIASQAPEATVQSTSVEQALENRLSSDRRPASVESTSGPYEITPKEPQRLVNFLRSPWTDQNGNVMPGGIRDPGGDVRDIVGGNKGRPGLINGRGDNLDNATMRAWQAGYLPEFSDRPMINDLLEKIDNDHNGQPVYSMHDQDAVAAYIATAEHNTEIDRLAAQYGIETRGKTREQFFDELTNHLSLEDRAQEIASQHAATDAAYREAEKQAKQWVVEHQGEEWRADKFYGQSQARSLRDLENEHQQIEAATASEQRTPGDEQPRPAEGDQGPVPEGAESRGDSAGAGRGDEAQADQARTAEPAGDREPIAHPAGIDPTTGRPATSWVIADKATGKAVIETRNPKAVEALNTEKYEAFPIGEWLRNLNKSDQKFRLAGDGLVESGERLLSQSGRSLQAPKIDTTTDRKLASTMKRMDAWLVDEARKEASGNDHLLTILPRDGSRLSPADRDLLNEVIFGRAEGPATSTRDLLGKPQEAKPAHAPESTIRNDPNQAAMPGMEASAVQAQAARDAQGRGALQSNVPQKPTNDGLFAPDTSGQGKLYAGPTAIFDPDAWKFMVGPLAVPTRAAVAAVRDVRNSLAKGIVPLSQGTTRAQNFAASFANSLRRVMYRYGEIDNEIAKTFKPTEREAMGRALDAQSVFEQQFRDLPPDQQVAARQAFDEGRTGVAGLTPPQRNAVEMLDTLSQATWRQMQERGMVDPNAQGLPYYFPRQILNWTEGEGFSRPGSGQAGAGRGLDQRGQNLTTSGPMSREHLTPEETEAAAKAKLGNQATLLRDIRSLPARLAFSQRAIAGVDLIKQIEDVGKSVGVDTVVHGDIPGMLQPTDYFTIADHPAFRKWTGSGWQATHVASEFEGPLKAVLTQASPTWYKAAAKIKGGVMSSIMYSPFIHLSVELGRALPVMAMSDPVGLLTLKALRDGSTLRRDLGFMDQATTDGLAPLGRKWAADPVSIADQANVEGRNRFIAALGNMRDAMANAAGKGTGSVFGKTVGQFVHDAVQHPHQTLLWDQVFNLQTGLYNQLRTNWIAKGYDPQVAGTMAAHIANRYAGALPAEHLSKGANMAANLLLFSRSFTLGNLGVMKDMFTGAPPHILSRINQMAGPEATKSAQSALQRKAIAAVTMDIGLFYMGNALLQGGIQAIRQGTDQTENDWMNKAKIALGEVSQGHLLSAFGVLPQHWNEPGKQDRVFAGTDSTGRGVYLRLPPGKVGEEFLNWFTKPGVMLEAKLSPLVRPIIEDIQGQDTLGRALYPPNPQTIGDGARIAWLAVKHIAEGLGPTSTIQGVHELWQQHVEGKQTQADPGVSALKLLGPLTGLAQVSSGYPGGPASGEMHAETEREKFQQQQGMPAIRDKIVNGDLDGARQDMTALGMAPGLQRYYLQHTLRPGPSAGQQKQFIRNAPPDVQQRSNLQRQ